MTGMVAQEGYLNLEYQDRHLCNQCFLNLDSGLWSVRCHRFIVRGSDVQSHEVTCRRIGEDIVATAPRRLDAPLRNSRVASHHLIASRAGLIKSGSHDSQVELTKICLSDSCQICQNCARSLEVTNLGQIVPNTQKESALFPVLNYDI